MPKIETILLDMDGVCCDFVSAACEIHGKNLEDLLPDWPAGEGWNFYEMWGATAEEFWKPINNDVFFWWELDEYEWRYELVDLLKESSEELVFASSPSKCPSSHCGKAHWLRNRGFCPSKDAMLGSRKELMGHPSTVLIDDNDRNCEKFRARGGHAIVFPQHWNSQHEKQTDRLLYVQEELEKIRKAD
jgi:5'(3')-deoxyribonucleotidase